MTNENHTLDVLWLVSVKLGLWFSVHECSLIPGAVCDAHPVVHISDKQGRFQTGCNYSSELCTLGCTAAQICLHAGTVRWGSTTVLSRGLLRLEVLTFRIQNVYRCASTHGLVQCVKFSALLLLGIVELQEIREEMNLQLPDTMAERSSCCALILL